MEKEQDYKIKNSESYKLYLAALCKLASQYVSSIRVQFAEKAYEMYANETVRKLVLAYGLEVEGLEKDRLRSFRYVSEYGATTPEHLNDSCLNNAHNYGAAIRFLFGI